MYRAREDRGRVRAKRNYFFSRAIRPSLTQQLLQRRKIRAVLLGEKLAPWGCFVSLYVSGCNCGKSLVSTIFANSNSGLGSSIPSFLATATS